MFLDLLYRGADLGTFSIHQFFSFYNKKNRATLIEFIESNTRISQMKQTSIIDQHASN